MVVDVCVLGILALVLPCSTLTTALTPRVVNGDDDGDLVRDIVKPSFSSPLCTVIVLADLSTHPFPEVTGWERNVILLTTTNTTLPTIVATVAKVRALWWCVTVVVSSADSDFFAKFAAQAVKARAVVRGMKVVVVTRLSAGGVGELLTKHWTFAMMNTVLINRSSQHKDRYGLYANLPYSGSGGGVVQLGVWKAGSGIKLRTHSTLFPNKYSNFHGARVPITALILPPFWKVVDTSAQDSWTRYSGRDCLLMKAVATALNFTFVMHKSSNIDEIMSSLERHVVLLSGFRIMLIPQILARVDHTYFIDRATFTFSMAKPSTKPQWQSLYYPLHSNVWLALLGLTAIMPVVMHVFVNHEGDQRSQTILKKNRFTTLETLGILVGQDIWHTLPTSDGPRFLVVLWLVFAFVMGTVYRGTLTAFLSVPKYPARPENMEELAQAGVRSKFTQNATRFLMYFKHSNLASYRSVASRVDIVTTVEDGLTHVSQENVAFFHERYNTELMIAEHFSGQDGVSELYVAKENVIPNYAAWMMPHDAPYKDDVDRWLLTVIESGLKKKFTDDMMREAWQEIRLSKKNQEQGDVQAASEATKKAGGGETRNSNQGLKPLSLSHLQGALFLGIFGLVMAAAVFLFEIISLTRLCRRSLFSE